MAGRKRVGEKRRQLVISMSPAELEQIQADLEAIGIEDRYRSEFFRQVLMDAIAVRKEGKIQVAFTEGTITELNKVISKPARGLTKKKGAEETKE